MDDITRARLLREWKAVKNHIIKGNVEYLFFICKTPGYVPTSHCLFTPEAGPALVGVLEINRKQISEELVKMKEGGKK